MKNLTNKSANIFCSEQELIEERQKTYEIFKQAMKEFNPDISEDTIMNAFEAKFGKNKKKN